MPSTLELLLLEDIPGIGQRNDIVVVKDGFALNNLLPRRRAIVLTPTVRKRYAEQIKRRAEEKAHMVDLARSAAEILKGKTLTLTKKASKTGKLYAAVNEDEIAKALREQHELTVIPEHVVIVDEMKTVGKHTARLKLDGEEIEFALEVKGEE